MGNRKAANVPPLSSLKVSDVSHAQWHGWTDNQEAGSRKAEGGCLHSPPGSQPLLKNCVWCIVGARLTLRDVVGFHQKW